MTIPARIDPFDSLDSRHDPRRQMRLTVLALGSETDRSFSAIVHDLSPGGMLIETAGQLADGDEVEIEAPWGRQLTARIIWSQGHYYGCRLNDAVSQASISAALLKSSFLPAAGNSMAASREAVIADHAVRRGLSLRARAGAILGLALLSWTPFLLLGRAVAG